jgi:hypothetical protein
MAMNPLLLKKGDSPQLGQRNAYPARAPWLSQNAPPTNIPAFPKTLSDRAIQKGNVKSKMNIQTMKSQHFM